MQHHYKVNTWFTYTDISTVWVHLVNVEHKWCHEETYNNKLHSDSMICIKHNNSNVCSESLSGIAPAFGIASFWGPAYCWNLDSRLPTTNSLGQEIKPYRVQLWCLQHFMACTRASTHNDNARALVELWLYYGLNNSKLGQCACGGCDNPMVLLMEETMCNIECWFIGIQCWWIPALPWSIWE